MSPSDRTLTQKLGIALVIKLVALTVLWFVFIRNTHVEVDAPQIAAHLVSEPSAHPQKEPRNE